MVELSNRSWSRERPGDNSGSHRAATLGGVQTPPAWIRAGKRLPQADFRLLAAPRGALRHLCLRATTEDESTQPPRTGVPAVAGVLLSERTTTPEPRRADFRRRAVDLIQPGRAERHVTAPLGIAV